MKKANYVNDVKESYFKMCDAYGVSKDLRCIEAVTFTNPLDCRGNKLHWSKKWYLKCVGLYRKALNYFKKKPNRYVFREDYLDMLQAHKKIRHDIMNEKK